MEIFVLAILILTFNETFTKWSENITNILKNAPKGCLEKTRVSAARPIARSSRHRSAFYFFLKNHDCSLFAYAAGPIKKNWITNVYFSDNLESVSLQIITGIARALIFSLQKMKTFVPAILILIFNENFTKWSENIANILKNALKGCLEKKIWNPIFWFGSRKF